MTLLEQLQAAAENARKGLPAALTIDADGVQPSALSGSKADCMRSVSGGNRENRHPRERLRCRYHARASL